MNRRAPIAIAASLAVAAVVAIVIFTVGYIPLPSYPSLVRHPDPAIAGTMALLTNDERGEESCLYTAPAQGGRPTRIRCGLPGYVEGVGWTAQGSIVVAPGDGGGTQVIDPVTRRVIAVHARPADKQPPVLDRTIIGLQRADGARVLVRRGRGSRIVIRSPDGTERTRLRIQRPESYSIVDVRWSPDGQWLLARDSEQQLLVLRADGTSAPRLLARHVDKSAWFIAGSASQTIDPKTQSPQSSEGVAMLSG